MDSETEIEYANEFQKQLFGGYLDTEQNCEKHPQNFFAAFILILVIVGLFGNFFIIFIIVTLKEYKKSVANWYILQLAAADALFLLSLPFEAVSEMRGNWIYPDWLCGVKQALLFINYYASIYFLMVMSFDRYLAVTKAFAFSAWVKTLRSPAASTAITVVGWSISIAACIPLYIYSDVQSCPRVCAHKFPLRECFEDAERTIPCNLSDTAPYHYAPYGSLYETPGYGENYEHNTHMSYLPEENHLLGYDPVEEGDYSGYLSGEGYLDGALPPLGSGNWSEFLGNGFEFNASNEEWLYPGDNNSDMYDTYINSQEGVSKEFCDYPDSPTLKNWVLANFIGAFCIPFVIICFFYGMIIRTILETGTVSNTDTQRSYRKRVTFIVLALVSLFAVSWLPWHVVSICKLNGFHLPRVGDCTLLNQAVRIVAYMNSAFNPYFYSFLGVKFKERMKRVSTRISGVFSNSSYRASIRNNDGNGPNRRRRPSGSNSNPVAIPQRYNASVGDQPKAVGLKFTRSFRGGWLNRSAKSKIAMNGIIDDETINRSTLQRTERTIV